MNRWVEVTMSKFESEMIQSSMDILHDRLLSEHRPYMRAVIAAYLDKLRELWAKRHTL